MTTLTITGSGTQDHTATDLTGVDVIEFNGTEAVVGAFAATQFSGTPITFIGDDRENIFYVDVDGNFSAAHFTFVNWSGSDAIRFNGASNGDTITGSDSGETIFGLGGADKLFGGEGNDLIDGGTGDDLLLGDEGTDTVSYLALISEGVSEGVTVNLAIKGPQDTGGGGVDTLSGFENILGSLFDDVLIGDRGANHLVGNQGEDVLRGAFGRDKLSGSEGKDILLGGRGKDVLIGGSEQDLLVGGRQKDILVGGSEPDVFDFNSIRDSVRGKNRDVITDFQRGLDDIDLRTIDAKKGVAGNQKFDFIGKQDFDGEKGQLRIEDKGAKVIVQGDVNGDGKSDFEILVKAGILHQGDFLL